MTVKSAPFYWVECDHPDCPRRCTDGMYEIVSWPTEDDARAAALDSDWREYRASGRWFCPDHEVEYCTVCGTHVGPLAGEQDYVCAVCEGVTG